MSGAGTDVPVHSGPKSDVLVDKLGMGNSLAYDDGELVDSHGKGGVVSKSWSLDSASKHGE